MFWSQLIRPADCVLGLLRSLSRRSTRARRAPWTASVAAAASLPAAAAARTRTMPAAARGGAWTTSAAAHRVLLTSNIGTGSQADICIVNAVGLASGGLAADFASWHENLCMPAYPDRCRNCESLCRSQVDCMHKDLRFKEVARSAGKGS